MEPVEQVEEDLDLVNELVSSVKRNRSQNWSLHEDGILLTLGKSHYNGTKVLQHIKNNKHILLDIPTMPQKGKYHLCSSNQF